MLTNELNQLQEELQYHRNSIQELEERITEVKVYDGYAAQATEAVEDAIKQIGMGKYLWLFKEHILSMFPEQPPAYLENKVEEKINLASLTEVHKTEVPQEVEEVKPEKSYYELTGKPNLRPTTYEDLAPNISYSSDGRAYVGFNDYSEAEKFRDAISEPSMIDDAVIMNGFKHEVKFHCSKEYVQELVDSVNSMSEEVQPTGFEKIDAEITYNHNDSICYMAFSAKGRAENYGIYLTKILDIGNKYTVSKDPQIVDAKYELRIEGIDFDSALHLQAFDLKKEWNAGQNEQARKLWRDARKREVEPACKPLPRAVALDEIELGEIVSVGSNSKQYKVINHVVLNDVPHLEVISTYNNDMPELVGQTSYLKEAYRVLADDIQVDTACSENSKELRSAIQNKKEVPKPLLVKKVENKFTIEDFPSAPYQNVSLNEIEPGDIVTTNPHSKSAYEVRAHNGDHLLAVCLYNLALPKRVGEEFYFKVPYLVEKCSQEIAA